MMAAPRSHAPTPAIQLTTDGWVVVGRSQRYLLAFAAAAVALVYGVAVYAATGGMGPPPTGYKQVVQFGFFASLVAIPALLGLRLRVEVRGSTLRLLNIIRDQRVDAADITALDPDGGLRIQLRDGRWLRSSAAQQALGAQLTGNKHAHRVAERLEDWLATNRPDTPPEADQPVRVVNRFRYPLLGLYLAWIAFFITSCAIAYGLTR
jgi:hypothetical protein